MGSTCSEQLLAYCLRGEEWPRELLDRTIQEDEGRALLSVVVERLGDLFEPRLCDVYQKLFAEVDRLGRAGSATANLDADHRRRSRHNPQALVRVRTVASKSLWRRRRSDQRLAGRGQAALSHRTHRISGSTKIVRNVSGGSTDRASGNRLRAADRSRNGCNRQWICGIDDGIVIDSDSRLSQLGLISASAMRIAIFIFPVGPMEARASGAIAGSCSALGARSVRSRRTRARIPRPRSSCRLANRRISPSAWALPKMPQSGLTINSKWN